MAPLPSSFKLNGPRPARFSWKHVEPQDRAIIKEVCIRARQRNLTTCYDVAVFLPWDEVAAAVGSGFTADYCREKAMDLWKYSDLAGGNMRLDRVAIPQRVVKHPVVQLLKGGRVKASKKPKSSHKALAAFQAREKIRASLLSKFAEVAE